MKKYSLTKTKPSPNSWIKGILPIIAGLVILLVFIFLLPRALTVAANIALWPLEIAKVIAPETSEKVANFFTDRNKLTDEINYLKGLLAVSEQRAETAQKLQHENAEFRALIDITPEERVVARVVARPPQLAYDFLMINKGSEQGVVLHAPVFSGRDQLIGFISEVKTNTALITLTTAPGFKATSYIIGPNIFTETEGMGGGVLRVHVPQGIDLQVEDIVILPAAESGIYGRIFEIFTEASQPERFGYVSPDISIQNLTYVSIGREAVNTASYEVARELIENIRNNLLTIDLPEGVLVTPEDNTSTETSTTTPSPAPTVQTLPSLPDPVPEPIPQPEPATIPESDLIIIEVDE